jgi:UDP-glucose 4-epimerase
MKTSLVTGGAGFMGSHVAEHLLKLGHRVIIVDDLSGGFEDNVPKGADLHIGTILDVGMLEAIFREHQFNYVFHLAAYAAEGLSHFIKRFNYMNNVVGSVNLINAAVNHGVERFVFTSSIAVYGHGKPPFDEDMAPHPVDSYGIAKHAVEQELEASRQMFGLDYTVFRPHNVYGERQNVGDLYRNVVGIFMRQLLNDEPMTIFGDGNQQRAFSYIGDVAPFIAESVCEKGRNQIFNIGSDNPVSVNELARLAALMFGKKMVVDYLPARNEVEVAFSRHRKAEELLGALAMTPLRIGLAKMADWVKVNGARQGLPFKQIEINKNLPPSWKP